MAIVQANDDKVPLKTIAKAFEDAVPAFENDFQNTKVKINGVWKNAVNVFVKVGGIWKQAEKVYVKNNGVWRSG